MPPAGDLEPVHLEAGGAIVPVYSHVAGPVDILPAGDSLVIAEPAQGGGYTFRIIAATGRGTGTPLLKPGEAFTAASRDWHHAPLTSTPVDEDGAIITPDGKTVIFQRYRNVRRIAIADLTKVLVAAPAGR